MAKTVSDESRKKVAYMGDRAFYPNVVYPLWQVARNLGVTEKWVKTHFVYTRECAFTKRGNIYMFTGDWILDWVMNNMTDAQEPV